MGTKVDLTLMQTPLPGANVLLEQGDSIRVHLTLSRPCRGRAFLITDAGRAVTKRHEIVREVEEGRAPDHAAWHNREMRAVSDTAFEIDLPLDDVDTVEAKAWFLPESTQLPVWPEGGNLVIQAIPACADGSLSVYEAFVRLFGSGTLADIESALPVILDEMGFGVLLLMPIFAVGKSTSENHPPASPYATRDLREIEPSLCSSQAGRAFEALESLGDAVHGRGAQLWLDMPINHTGWHSHLLREHPDWVLPGCSWAVCIARCLGCGLGGLGETGSQQSRTLEVLADVLLFWCERGVDGFRCDAGHMIPAEVWRYLVAKVRLHFPETRFLLEGLGGSWEDNQRIVREAGIGLVYSELFQKQRPDEIREHLQWCERLNERLACPVHFAETHDSPRLAARSKNFARMRTHLAALTSHRSAWGITCGAEWFADEKILVHDRTSLGWGAEDNQVAAIGRLNQLLREHPCFARSASVTVADAANPHMIALWRTSAQGDVVWVLVNLDLEASQWAHLNAFGKAKDLITQKPVSLTQGSLLLGPAAACCLTSKPERVTGMAAKVRSTFNRSEVEAGQLSALLTNGTGAMAQVRGSWGQLRSQYDCLLGANLDPHRPVDRQVLVSRCRAWIGVGEDVCEVNVSVLTRFGWRDHATSVWEFDVPLRDGLSIALRATLHMLPGRNAIQLGWERLPGTGPADGEPVLLRLRPDIEDRSFHRRTHAWDASVVPLETGFTFGPTPGHRLEMRLLSGGGQYVDDPAWTLGVPYDLGAERGLNPCGDLFNPGEFLVELAEGECVHLLAEAFFEGEPRNETLLETKKDLTGARSLEWVLGEAMDSFLVRRDAHQSIIAGYPWFLDWGRDTLIGLRGFIAAGRLPEAESILANFAQMELRGTLPNMIHGHDATDRDTSDAPLWFGVACWDYVKRAGTDALYQMVFGGGRTIREVILSIGRHYRDGAANGVHMDVESGLIFSPAHYTWMDTNDPPCTPREGYPIEIQALWFAYVELLGEIDPAGGWSSLANQVRQSVHQLFTTNLEGGLADCLAAVAGTPACEAVPDCSIRPNQLFALTLGLIQNEADQQRILDACEELVVPGALRSLSRRDPGYHGRYRGPEDESRKPAYHNGTAWVWLYPTYVEARHQLGDRKSESLLAPMAGLLKQGCLGQLPEILDGDPPHHQRGCGAQAWSVTEFYRVWQMIIAEQPETRRLSE